MRMVTVTYKTDQGSEVDVSTDLNDAAISDLIEFMEGADGDEDYEKGDHERF